MPSPQKIDINKLANDPKKTLELLIKSPETRAEIGSRIRQQEAEADHQRRKDLIVYAVVCSLVCIGFLVSALVVLFSLGTADTQKTSVSLITMIVSAAVGFMTGKGSK